MFYIMQKIMLFQGIMCMHLQVIVILVRASLEVKDGYNLLTETSLTLYLSFFTSFN